MILYYFQGDFTRKEIVEFSQNLQYVIERRMKSDEAIPKVARALSEAILK